MDLQEIVETLEFLDDWEDKYRFVIDAGKTVPEMDESLKCEENLVRGCQSQVWLVHDINADGTLSLQIDSDAHIVRGLISLVLAAYAGKTPAEARAYDIEGLFKKLALLEHLSQTRGNGLRAMIQRVQDIAAAA